jgi:hypothetical protein
MADNNENSNTNKTPTKNTNNGRTSPNPFSFLSSSPNNTSPRSDISASSASNSPRSPRFQVNGMPINGSSVSKAMLTAGKYFIRFA